MIYRKRIVIMIISLVFISLAFANGVVAQPKYPVCSSPSTLPIKTVGEWVLGTPMPTPRAEAAVTYLDGKIYVAGGLTLNDLGSFTPALEVYDIATDSWEQLAPLPTLVHHTQIRAIDGKLYIAGGFNVDFVPIVEGWVYDIATDTWDTIAPLPEPRGAHQLLVFDDQLWVVGGGDESADEIDNVDILVYDPPTNTWNAGPTVISHERNHLSSVQYDDVLYVIGGRFDGEVLNLLERYNRVTGMWDVLPELPTPRSGTGAAVLNGMIHFIGGESLDGSFCSYDRHEVFDIKEQTWAVFNPLPVARHGLAVVSDNERLYVIGGATGSNIETFNSATNRLDIFVPATATN